MGVKLYQAHYFTCENCSSINYLPAMCQEFTPSESADCAMHHGGNASDYTSASGWCAIPGTVACGKCGHESDVEGLVSLGDPL